MAKEISKTAEKLIKQGFEVLDCPQCGTKCEPVIKYKNDTVRYRTHYCVPFGLHYLGRQKAFSINSFGELVGD